MRKRIKIVLAWRAYFMLPNSKVKRTEEKSNSKSLFVCQYYERIPESRKIIKLEGVRGKKLQKQLTRSLSDEIELDYHARLSLRDIIFKHQDNTANETSDLDEEVTHDDDETTNSSLDAVRPKGDATSAAISSEQLGSEGGDVNGDLEALALAFSSRATIRDRHAMADGEQRRDFSLPSSSPTTAQLLSPRVVEEDEDAEVAATTPRQGATDDCSVLLSSGQRVMYPRKFRNNMTKNPVCGGQPISPEQAHGLRRVVFGNASVPTRSEWLTTGFAFRDPDVEFAYGLRVPSAARPSTRALLMAVQAYVVRHLLFERYLSQSPPRSSNTDEPDTSVLRPSRIGQTDALHSTLSTILWRIADKGKAWVCLPQDTAYVHQSQEYFQDGVTEKLHLFEFSDLETLQIFIKRYIYVEDPGPGSLLFLYSAVLTRGISKTQSDLSSERSSLAVSSDEGQQCIVTLMLTGRATPYLHNGVVYAGDENSYSRPQFGVLTRSDVGLLVHDDNSENQIPGSRLKTPSVPVWVTYATGHYGVLFNTNKDLLRDYHAERRFDLMYYNCSPLPPTTQAVLSVDTRFGESGRDEMGCPQLERVIHTKWQDARVNWNGITPFV